MDLRSLMQWPEFTNWPQHSGPTMTLAGTGAKLAILTALFFIGGFFSWKHFHERAQQIDREQEQAVAARSPGKPLTDAEADKVVDSILKIDTVYKDRDALQWQRPYLIERELRYPLFAWLLFFLGAAPFFLRWDNKATWLAPVCVALEGIAFGSTEALLAQRYPGITLLGLTLTAGLMLTILAAFWMGVLDGRNPFLLCVVGVIGAIAFTYVSTTVARSLGYPLEYLHDGPKNWWTFVSIVLAVETTIAVFACRQIGEAIDAGAPKWMEWRAALRIFVSFVALARATRWLLKARSSRTWR